MLKNTMNAKEEELSDKKRDNCMSFVWIYGEKIYNKQAQSSQSKHQTSTEPEWTLPHIKSDALNKPNAQ